MDERSNSINERMRMKWIAAVLWFSLAATSAWGEAPERSAWIAGWDTPRGLSDLRANSAAFDEVTVFAYEFDRQGRLLPADETGSVIAEARGSLKPGAKLVIAVVNDVMGKQGKQP